MQPKFKLWHSLVGIVVCLVVEYMFVLYAPLTQWWVLLFAALGALSMLYVATEVIEEVRNARHMLVLLGAVLAEFVLFFAFQYAFLLQLAPQSYPTLPPDWVSLILHSTMIFVFNPLYLPATWMGRALLLINTLAALGLVLFILQNVWQFRRREV